MYIRDTTQEANRECEKTGQLALYMHLGKKVHQWLNNTIDNTITFHSCFDRIFNFILQHNNSQDNQMAVLPNGQLMLVIMCPPPPPLKKKRKDV